MTRASSPPQPEPPEEIEPAPATVRGEAQLVAARQAEAGPTAAVTSPAVTSPAVTSAVGFDDDEDITQRHQTLPTQAIRTLPTLTILSGKGLGRLIALKEVAIIGRAKSADVVLRDRGLSRKHARIKRWVGQAFVLEDLGSTNGTFVNGRKILRSSLALGDVIQFGPSVRVRFDVLDASEVELRRQLFDGNVRDPSTRLFSRRHLDEQIRVEVAHGRRHESDVAVMVVQLDNQVGGGSADGDRLLGQVAARVVSCSRIEDFIARYDESTIAMVLRASPMDAALQLAERIRLAIAEQPFEIKSKEAMVTVSMGIATLERLELFAESSAMLDQAIFQLSRAALIGPGNVMHAEVPT